MYTASGIAALIKTALCLHYRFIPGMPDWNAPSGSPVYWANSPFYIPVRSRPWILEDNLPLRAAAVNSISADSTCSHIVMSEAPPHLQGKRQKYFVRQSSVLLFPVAGNNLSELQGGLDRLRRVIEKTDSLTRASAANYSDFRKAAEPVNVVSIAGGNKNGILKEIRAAGKGIETAVKKRKPWQSPSGSYFTPDPLGKNAKIAFVYPGSFTSYIDLGRTLFQLFPDLLGRDEKQAKSAGGCLFNTLLYPRSMHSTEREPGIFREKFHGSPMKMISIGASFSALYTQILKKYLKITPASAFGYSMGETAGMMVSLGVWDQAAAAESFQSSRLFRDRLVGENKLLDEVWGPSTKNAKDRWTSLTLFASAEKVREIVGNYKTVYLTFINTPREVIISGIRKDCFEAAERLNCRFVEMEISAVVHSDPVFKEYDELVSIHDVPVNRTADDIDFYSGVEFDRIKMSRHVIAHNSARLCCSMVDFNRLVSRVYDDGARIFIEVGAGAACTRWIDEILKEQPHLAVPTNRKGVPDIKTLVALLARLLSHGVRTDSSWLYGDNSDRNKLVKRIILGGENTYGNIIDGKPVKPDHPAGQIQPRTSPGSTGTAANAEEKEGSKNIIWDERDLLEFASGSISSVFGKEYEIIDTYPVRTRLPLPPYLFVSRVTRLDAEKGRFKPSFIQTEYDIPVNSWYSTDGQIPWAVVVESGQCDLLLVSYLGIDIELKGRRVYRLLNCNFTFLDDMPREGDTLRYDISINSFSQNGGTALFFFSYECYVENRLIMKMDGGCAGFFTREQLSGGQGVVYTQKEISEKKNVKKEFFAPPLDCGKTRFEREDLLKLTSGDLQGCFGENYFPDKKNPSLRFPPEKIMMIDRVTAVDVKGGARRLGAVTAEKDIAPDHWYFPCHFKDDNVMPGTLLAEGGTQLLQFYMLYSGLQSTMKDARFQPILNLPQKVRCRKEVGPACKKMVYVLEVKETGLLPEPYAIADVEVFMDGQVAVVFENLGWKLSEKNPKEDRADKNNSDLTKNRERVLISEQEVLEFTLGSAEKCFGPEYAVYDSHKTTRMPNTDFRFVTRIVSSDGERYNYNDNPAMVSQYDVPADAWYFLKSMKPVIPYSILMEIALQPCGFFSTYLGTVLRFPETDFYFRNLDGEGKLIKEFDLRGKTIENRVTLISSVTLGETIIQSYRFRLASGENIIFTGRSSFGFFKSDALSGHTGLDSGNPSPPWYRKEKVPEFSLFQIDLTAENFKSDFLQAFRDKTMGFRESGRLNLIHRLKVMKNGGLYGKGYIYATRFIKPWEWFFACHFYQDPVMPGSLGVEAMLQAVRAFVLAEGLGNHLKSPVFSHPENHKTAWKYRGQILRQDREMSLEVHIKCIESKEQRIIVTGDGSLWNGNMRIYEVTDLAVVLVDLKTHVRTLEAAPAAENPRKAQRAMERFSMEKMTIRTEGTYSTEMLARPPLHWTGELSTIAFDPEDIKNYLLDLSQPCYAVKTPEGRTGIANSGELISSKTGGSCLVCTAVCPPVRAEHFGDRSFLDHYSVKYAYYAGSMANAISSEEFVISLGKNRILGCFGAGGLVPSRIEEAIAAIQKSLPRRPYAFNLIYNPGEETVEAKTVELYLRHGVRTIEASAYMELTPYLVHYRAAGLESYGDEGIAIKNKIIAKISRRETAKKFMEPAPEKFLGMLRVQGKITGEQARLAMRVPMADDITVEADSAGHTDNRPLLCLLGSIISLRDEICERSGHLGQIRVGAAGGIGTPHAALAAFMMGASYIVTGSINQCADSGASDYVKKLLAQVECTDVMMAPSSDMFEMGVKLQVLKRGTIFPLRAAKLWKTYTAYSSIEDIPGPERDRLEKQIFQKDLESVWQDTVEFFNERDPQQICAARSNPKKKMSLIFRWYLGLSSLWAITGKAGREIDYQIWCGPAMGSFNHWVKGTYLENPENRKASEIAGQIMNGTAYLYRLQHMKLQGVSFPRDTAAYKPAHRLLS